MYVNPGGPWPLCLQKSNQDLLREGLKNGKIGTLFDDGFPVT